MATLPTTPAAYEELLAFALRGKTPEEVMDFRPSLKQQERIRLLVAKAREATLTSPEEAELDTAAELEHLVVLMKMKAASQIGE